ncbi:MAG: transglutaminase family protein [Pseudomonadota bacterium]
MLLSVRHTTEYAYAEPVEFALQKLRLRPLESPLQSVRDWEVAIDGGRIEAAYRDHYANHVDLVSAERGTKSLTITASGRVETRDTAGVLGKVYSRAPLWHFRQSTPLTHPGDSTRQFADGLRAAKDTLTGLHDLSGDILKKVPYAVGHTQPDTTAEEAVQIGQGVCQDHANIFIAAVRAAGLPARYVSGYLMMNDRVDQDASHAWAEVHLDDLGWVSFDVSNGVCPDGRYIRLAIGRDAHDAAPVQGLRGGAGDESLIVSLQVQQ